MSKINKKHLIDGGERKLKDVRKQLFAKRMENLAHAIQRGDVSPEQALEQMTRIKELAE